MGGALKARASSIVFGIVFVLLGNLFAYSIATSHLGMGGDEAINPSLFEAHQKGVSYYGTFILHINWARLGLGVEIVGGEMSVLIPRMTVLPVRKSKVFTTTRDQQTSVTIKVFQGLSGLTKNCLFLGEFNLTGIPPAPRGTPQIKVTFKVDSNYTLTVTAEEEAYGISEKITILQENYIVMFEDVDEMMRKAEEEEKAEKDRNVGPHSLKTYVYNHINDKDKLKKEKEKETSTSDDPSTLSYDLMIKELALKEGRERFKNNASTSGDQIAERGEHDVAVLLLSS